VAGGGVKGTGGGGWTLHIIGRGPSAAPKSLSVCLWIVGPRGTRGGYGCVGCPERGVLNEEAVEIGEAAGAGSSKVSCGLRRRRVGEAGRAGPKVAFLCAVYSAVAGTAAAEFNGFSPTTPTAGGHLNVVGKSFRLLFLLWKAVAIRVRS